MIARLLPFACMLSVLGTQKDKVVSASASEGRATVVVEETAPPESIFKNLKPSEHRYTVLGRNRDEL